MFLAEPFILASEFVQHILLLVLCGVVVTEFCIRLRWDAGATNREHGTFALLGVAVFMTSFWVIAEYFVPVKTLPFFVFVHAPITVAVVLCMYRIPLEGTPGYFRWFRALLATLFIAHVVFDVAYTLTLHREQKMMRSLIKTSEVFALYGFVIHYARYSVMRASGTLYRSLSTESIFPTVFVRAALLVLCFALYTPSVSAFSLTTRIGDQSTELQAGDRLYFDVEIKWPENDRRQDLRVEYQILEEGKVIASEKVLRAVETQASFLDYLVVPSNADAGMKELRVILETYDKSLSESISATFHVSKSDNKLLIYFIILASAIALVVLLVIFQIVMISRTQRILAEQRTSSSSG